MGEQKRGKLNRLQSLLPAGLLVDTAWLESRAYASSLRSKYVSRGWLIQPARGVYMRPGEPLRWESVVVSLQSLLRFPVIVGGRTALELQGYAHYLSPGERQVAHLFADTVLPGWLDKLELPTTFVRHKVDRLFPEQRVAASVARLLPDANGAQEAAAPNATTDGLATFAWGERGWSIVLSTPERAVLELLDELPDKETFHQVDVLVDGLRNLSPRRVQALLRACGSVKVKRLFLWFAERHGHAWARRLDTETLDLGKGKRSIAKGGRFDSKYRITVPTELFGDA